MLRNGIWLGLLITCLASGVQAASNPQPSVKQMEDELFSLVNHERSLRGLSALRPDVRLHALARAHCLKMVRENHLDHNFPGYPRLSVRAARVGLHFGSIGENLAVGDTTIMRYFHEQMLASPGHSENTLDKNYTHMGIGIVKSNGKFYVTQEFAHLYDP